MHTRLQAGIAAMLAVVTTLRAGRAIAQAEPGPRSTASAGPERTVATVEGAADAAACDRRLQAMEARLRTLEAQVVERATTDAGSAGSTSAAGPVTSATQGTSHASTPARLTLAGYAEVFYQWNFNQPSNGITNFRGFDNRHNTFTLSNVVLDANGALGPVTAHLALQVGHTPETYYLAEPRVAGAAGAGSSDFNVWKFVQQAVVAWRAPIGRGLLIEAGLFLSPVGPEGMAVHEQWNWSRSNLFFGLPFYHAGARASYPLTDRLTLTLAAYNGWNNVVDNNAEKSVSAAFDYVVTDRVTFHVLYLGGVERATGAVERGPGGRAWRHLFDSYIALYPRSWLSFLGHANTGFEVNSFGTSWWAAGALYTRVQPASWAFVAVRADFFYEHVPATGAGTASAIFWPSTWVSSQTVTLDVRPEQNLSIRIEYRHDQAAADTYFRGAVSTDPLSMAFVPNARLQDTVTLGMTAWF